MTDDLDMDMLTSMEEATMTSVGGNTTLIPTVPPMMANTTPPWEVMYMQNTLSTLRQVTLALYLLTFLFGITGNSLTILVILRNKRMKTVATCFILNLAVADDLFMLSLPFMAHNTFTKDWVFGKVLCKISTAFFGVNLYASVYTMVLMSVDRYLAIVHPLKSMRYRTKRNAIVVCVLVWVVCFVIMTPYWMYADATYSNRTRVTVCRVIWPAESVLEHRWFWTNFELIIGFCLPVFIIVVGYLGLVKHLVQNRGPVQDQARKPIKKVTLMVFIVTLVFILCWTPYRIFAYTSMQRARAFIRHGVHPSFQARINSAIFNSVAQALVFVSSCCNPFIYAISSTNFRRLYLAVVCWSSATWRRRSYLRQTNSFATKGRRSTIGGTTSISRTAEETFLAGGEISDNGISLVYTEDLRMVTNDHNHMDDKIPHDGDELI